MQMAQTFFRGLSGALAALALACLMLVPAAAADEATDKATLDTLFGLLHDAPDEATANAISNKIWSIWTTPSDPDLDLRMRDVLEARAMRSVETTIELLDQLIVDYPAYAEGWNQRATMHFIAGNLEASIADCARVLELEPRHYGALSGRAMIYLQQGKRSLALRDMRAALALHPFLGERLLFPELQRDMTRT